MREPFQRWYNAFSDPAGGFHERLNKHIAPEPLPKRLLTQCRQIFVYGSEGADLSRQWDFVKTAYRVPETGGWKFSQADDTYDLYVHGFVLLACATLRKTEEARATIDFIHARFRRPGAPGFASAMDAHLVHKPGALAQNPHMHLFEGALAMAEISHDPVYADTAREILDLWFSHFFDGVVREYHDGENANLIEGGHQSEWIWLLTRYRDVLNIHDPRIAPAMASLWDWVKAHGIDKTHGGILNAQTREGVILDEKKRIWPVCETLRAARIMGDAAVETDMLAVLNGYYLRPDGFWNEVLNRDLTPATDYLPGTTVYHLYPVLRDGRNAA
jgi:mannose-6-phosphate isomerase